MTIFILLIAALILPAALFYLTVATNEFEKSSRTLAEAIQKRYTWEPPRKAPESAAMKSMMRNPGK